MKQSKREQKSRETGTQRPRRVIRVLTEGKVTERSYLRKWERRNREVHIDFADFNMAPRQMVKQARDYQQTNRQPRSGSPNLNFDEIWCIFDVDQHPKVSQALHEARQSNIRVALSNPCFELWLVLHFEDQTGHISSQSVQERAIHLGAVDGKQLSNANFDALATSYEAARTRAMNLEERHRGNDSSYWENPSTNVWELIDQLR